MQILKKNGYGFIRSTCVCLLYVWLVLISSSIAYAQISEILVVERHTSLGGNTIQSETGRLLDSGQFQVVTTEVHAWSPESLAEFLPVSGYVTCDLIQYTAYKNAGYLDHWVRSDRLYHIGFFDYVIVCIQGVCNPNPPYITSGTPLPAASLSQSYTHMLTVSAGSAPFTWSIISGSLPQGVTIASTSGVISGTPSQSGTFIFRVRVVDSQQREVMKDFTLPVASLPNLTPFQPSGWSDKIVVSRTTGTTMDSTSLTTLDTLYVDCAVLNNGADATANGFYVALYVDGVFKTSWYRASSLNANYYYIPISDYSVGTLNSGAHTIKVVTDYTGAIAESNEGDNEYTKTISISLGSTDDCYEPNDTLATAYDFTGEQTWLSTKGCSPLQSDNDWYEILVSPAGYERVQIDCRFTDADGDIDIQLVNALGTVLASSASASDNEFIDYVVPSAGTYYIRVYYGNADNTYDLWWDDVSVPAPAVSYLGHTIDDDTSGGSIGNGDGQVDSGETVELVVTLQNTGSGAADNVSATLSTTDSYVTSISDNYETYGSIAAGGTAKCTADYDFSVSSTCPDGHVIIFTLAVTADGYSWTDTFQITVHGWLPPSITSVSPNPVLGSASPQTITINGANFVNKPTLTLTWTGQSGYIVPSSQVTFVSSTQVQMAITTTTAPDNWTVRATNPDGQSSSQAAFTVITPNLAPSISSVTPNPITADPANGYQTLTINGANFVNKPMLTLTWTGQPGYTLPASRVTFVSGSELTMSIRLGAEADNWTVGAINPDSQQSNVKSFQVLAPATAAPSISSVTPDPVLGSASQQTITINGANFVNKPTLTLTWIGQSGYMVPSSQVTFVSSTQIQLTITTTTAPDNWTVRVTNPNGQSSGQLNFAVTGTTGQPNLIPQNVTLSSYSVQAGNQVTVHWTIANPGGANCSASITGLRLGQSPTSHPTSDPSLNSIFATPAINAGLLAQQSTTVTIPANSSSGTYYVWVIADNVANSTLHQSSTTDDYAHSPGITVGSVPSVQGEPASLGVQWRANPNFRERGMSVDTIVLHTTQGSTAQGAMDTLLVRGLSAHYVIESTGEIYQLVELSKSAYHANYYNDRSIGIEMVGFDTNPSTWNSQNLAALKNLVAYLVTKYNIAIVHPPGDASTYPDCLFTASGLVAHSQIQPGCNSYALKTDPGLFPWAAFVPDVQTVVDVPRFATVGGAGSQPAISGQFQVQVSTPSQQSITVQASENPLLNWSDIGIINPVDGKSVFTDTDAGAHAKRFYKPKP